jgi:hypothetical protein
LARREYRREQFIGSILAGFRVNRENVGAALADSRAFTSAIHISCHFEIDRFKPFKNFVKRQTIGSSMRPAVVEQCSHIRRDPMRKRPAR